MIASNGHAHVALAWRFFVRIGVALSRDTCYLLFACGRIAASSVTLASTLSRISKKGIPRRTKSPEALRAFCGSLESLLIDTYR
jgi:hypothetical protein